MKKNVLAVVITFALVSRTASAIFATPYVPGNWMVGGGFGLTFGPTLVMINPELDYIVSPKVFFGPSVQLGIGDNSTLFSIAGSIKYFFGENPRLRPFALAALGVAVASGSFSGSAGVLIQAGMGVDYQLSRKLAVGSTFRFNIAPPLKTFFVSWPIVHARFLL